MHYVILLPFHLPLRESRSTPSFVVIAGNMVRFASKRSKRSQESFGATFRKHNHGLKIYFGPVLRDSTLSYDHLGCPEIHLDRGDPEKPTRPRRKPRTRREYFILGRDLLNLESDLIFLGWASGRKEICRIIYFTYIYGIISS